ncbi:hypothetical protein Pelo_19421 [Pelomyxa schiedti]|nr:hypothetical protein Pelo_19421 [Pelomyxa schiedti]
MRIYSGTRPTITLTIKIITTGIKDVIGVLQRKAALHLIIWHAIVAVNLLGINQPEITLPPLCSGIKFLHDVGHKDSDNTTKLMLVDLSETPATKSFQTLSSTKCSLEQVEGYNSCLVFKKATGKRSFIILSSDPRISFLATEQFSTTVWHLEEGTGRSTGLWTGPPSSLPDMGLQQHPKRSTS